MALHRRTPPAVDVSPAERHTLLTGEWSPPLTRSKGWVELAFVGHGAPYEQHLAALWAKHGAALLGEAAAHGFTPHYISGIRPEGDGFAAWQQQFIAEHCY